MQEPTWSWLTWIRQWRLKKTKRILPEESLNKNKKVTGKISSDTEIALGLSSMNKTFFISKSTLQSKTLNRLDFNPIPILYYIKIPQKSFTNPKSQLNLTIIETSQKPGSFQNLSNIHIYIFLQGFKHNREMCSHCYWFKNQRVNS